MSLPSIYVTSGRTQRLNCGMDKNEGKVEKSSAAIGLHGACLFRVEEKQVM